MATKYFVGQMLEVTKDCGFIMGDKLPITEIKDNGYIVIDNVGIMPIDVVDVCFKCVDRDVKLEIKDLRSKLEILRKQQIVLRDMVKETMDSCKHEDLDVESYGTAKCKICDKNFSWYCPTSPTLTCDYDQEDGDYDEDDCIYCHQPEERK